MASAASHLLGTPRGKLGGPRAPAPPSFQFSASGSAGRGQGSGGSIGYGSTPLPNPGSAPLTQNPGSFGTGVPYNPSGSAALEEYQRRLREQAASAAAPNPQLVEQQRRLAERLSADTTASDIERSGGAISDAAAGQKAAARIDQARRGVLGGGTGAQGMGRIDDRTARLQAGAAADITSANERRKDALVIQGQGIMSATGEDEFRRNNALNQGWLNALGGAQGQDRLGLDFANQGLNQYATVRGLDLRDQEQQQRQYAQWLALMQQFAA